MTNSNEPAERVQFNHPDCPRCGAAPKEQEVRNYDPMWQEGKVYCKKCGTYVRDYDASI